MGVRDGSEVKLIEVISTRFEGLSDFFTEYDTEYYYNKRSYKLPKKGDCLVLLFLGDGANQEQELFTTVRRMTPEKEQYYRRLRGQRLIVKIEGENMDTQTALKRFQEKGCTNE